jgi:hypothetical protein
LFELPRGQQRDFEWSTLHLAEQKKINWVHVSTLTAVTILVGTEVVGASWAAGWALGGLLQLDPLISHIIEAVFALSGFALLYFFMRTAIRHEPIR